MPLVDLGSLFLNHVVFLTHLVYVNIAFTHAEPSFLVVLYFISKLFASRPEDLDAPPWPPVAPKCTATYNAAFDASAKRPAFVPQPSGADGPDPEKAPGNSPPREQLDSSNQSTLNGILSNVASQHSGGKVGIRDRIACHQWTWFTMTMATGGIANVMHTIPYRSAWLEGLGVAFFLFNILLFIMNCTIISLRFYLRPGDFIRSFTDQLESLFIPAFFVSLAIIFINICEYGVPHVGPWLLQTMEVMFWMYVGLAIVASAGMYLILWSTLIFPIHTMTPTWVFPAYPLLLTGPFAGTLIASATVTQHPVPINTTAIALCAVTTQGTGCLIAFMISAAFIYRLMTQKLPRDMQRPGVFISIGPFAFTVSGIVQLGSQAELIVPNGFMGDVGAQHAIFTLRILSVMVGLWLWGLAMWFFLVSVGSLWKYLWPNNKIPFQMTWWSFVFPNTALVTATEALGKAFKSDGFKIFGCVMAGCLVVVWIIVFITMLRCLKRRELLWPKEDK